MRRLCPALGHCPEHIVQIGLADGQNHLGMRLKTKTALIFIRTVSAVRKGLELALSRGDIVIRKPPVKHSLDIPSGEEVEGSAAIGTVCKQKRP